MSISTYSELQTAVGVWLDRADLSSYVADFIALAETRIFYGSGDPFPSEPIRVRAMQARATGSVASNVISYPTRFLEPIRLKVADGTSGWTLEYVTPSKYTELANNATDPSYYTFLNNQIETAGTDPIDYTLDYYQAFEALSVTSTNWLLTNAPGVYLYGALIEAHPFIGDDARLSTWGNLYKSLVTALNRTTKAPASGSLAVMTR